MSASFVLVIAHDNDEPIELPCDEDKILLLTTLCSQFPGACGLRYTNTSTGRVRGVRLDEGRLLPPDDDWGQVVYQCVFPKGVAEPPQIIMPLSTQNSSDLFFTPISPALSHSTSYSVPHSMASGCTITRSNLALNGGHCSENKTTNSLGFAQIAPKEEKESYFWNHSATKMLLFLYKQNIDLLQNQKIRKKKLWEKISSQMNVRTHNVTATQCENKFKHLLNLYKKIKANNNKSDSDLKRFPHMESMEEIFINDPAFTPISRASSSNGYTIIKKLTKDPDMPGTSKDPKTPDILCASNDAEPPYILCASKDPEPPYILCASKDPETPDITCASKDLETPDITCASKEQRQHFCHNEEPQWFRDFRLEAYRCHEEKMVVQKNFFKLFEEMTKILKDNKK